MQKRGSAKAQIWVETVIYTLIGLAIIGIVLGIATPKIKEMTDRAIIEQTISAFYDLDKEMRIVKSAIGNSRIVGFNIKKGSIAISSQADAIYYTMEDTGAMYSQLGKEIEQGGVRILTEQRGDEDRYNVKIILDYSTSFDLTYNEQSIDKTLTQAPTAYQVLIRNKGNKVIDFNLI